MRRAAVASKVPQSRALKAVKELDAFPKVPDNFKQTTVSGGGVSVVTFVVIIILVISEIHYYTRSELKFDYVVDTAVDGKLKINIDMTVAMTCNKIGADVLDQTGQDTQSFGKLNMENTHYALSVRQQRYHEITQQVNQYMREQYHAIQELMWLSGHQPGLKLGMPEREDQRDDAYDACRVHGSLELNKVAGNFHITAGKYYPQLNLGLGHVHLENFLSDTGNIVWELVTMFANHRIGLAVNKQRIFVIFRSYPHPKGHIHITGMVEPYEYNFTHRIDHFSFGDRSGGIINPLDGEEQVTKSNYHLFQYFMKVVPTEVRTYSNQIDTYQFSVTERNRSINHHAGSHGMPGIFVKYDLFPFKIRVVEEHRPYSQFLIRLCGIVGGIFVVSGLLHDGLGVVVDILCCRFKIGKYSANKNLSKGDSLLISPDTNDNQFSRENSRDSSGSHSFEPVDLLEDLKTDTNNIASPFVTQNGDNSIGDKNFSVR